MSDGRNAIPRRALFFSPRRRFAQTLLCVPRVLVYVAIVTIAAFAAAVAACNPDEWAE